MRRLFILLLSAAIFWLLRCATKEELVIERVKLVRAGQWSSLQRAAGYRELNCAEALAKADPLCSKLQSISPKAGKPGEGE